MLRRFGRTERSLHWVHATGFLAMLATGLVLYLPVRGDFARGAGARWALGMLRAEGIPFEDLTDCVQSVPEADRFVEGHGHYSPRTNEAVAEHVLRLLR